MIIGATTAGGDFNTRRLSWTFFLTEGGTQNDSLSMMVLIRWDAYAP